MLLEGWLQFHDLLLPHIRRIANDHIESALPLEHL
jgi:hypothetical protein